MNAFKWVGKLTKRARWGTAVAVLLGGASLIGYRLQGTSALGNAAAHAQSGGSASPQTSGQPFYAQSEAEAQRQGLLSYRDRPAEIQAVMQRMWLNDSRYQALTALFVDHEPMLPDSSLRVEVQQPNVVRVAVFDNDRGAGPAREQVVGEGDHFQIYAPQANAYATMPRLTSQPTLMPLASVPLSVMPREENGTSIFSTAASASLADLFIHPAGLITSPFFANKVVTIERQGAFAGRSAWELRGEQIPTAPVLSRLGDRWHMWVDTQTGIVLRIEYYRGTDLMGWAELQDLTIDGAGGTAVSGTAASVNWAVPNGARHVDIEEYRRLAH